MPNGKSTPFVITVFLYGHSHHFGSHHFRPTWISSQGIQAKEKKDTKDEADTCVCVFAWRFNVHFCTNSFPHTEHLNGFSPVCVRM